MREIRNATHEPLKINLGQGKVLHLGPGAVGRIAADAVERPAIKAMIDGGEIEVVGGGDGHGDVPNPAVPQVQTHGHHPPTGNLTKGNR